MYAVALLQHTWLGSPGITPGDLQGVGGIVAFILGTVVLFLYRRSVAEASAHQAALCTAWDRERAELITQRDKATQQRDDLTQTFHDFVRDDRANTLEALKTSNQIAEDLLVKDETSRRRIEQLERDLEWERRRRGD